MAELVALYVVGRYAPVGHDVYMPFPVACDLIDVIIQNAVLRVFFLLLIYFKVLAVVQAYTVVGGKP